MKRRPMRQKINNQLEFNFQPSNLKITNKYFEQYEKISSTLENNPKIYSLVHKDLDKILRGKKNTDSGRNCKYASDTILRIIICQIIEGESLRGIVIRIDDSHYLRDFTRIYNGGMIGHTRLCSLKNAISPKTWEEINKILTKTSVANGEVKGEKLRIDTTAYETNIHWPTDSSLLWDTYKVLSRLVEIVREIDPEIAADKRLHKKQVKKLCTKIARIAGKKKNVNKKTKKLYNSLITRVEGILNWMPIVIDQLRESLNKNIYSFEQLVFIERLEQQIEHFRTLGIKVVDQTLRRVFKNEKVPNTEKVFSIFESHTELLKRGKAGKPIEFGHMISIQQTEEKFITDYRVFKKKPMDYTLVDFALKQHRKIFGTNPEEFSADKGFYENMEKIYKLEEEIDVVSICKKGKRTKEEIERESNPFFKLGQRFRAGVEGSISFLKRALGMWRCMNKGWEHYVATVGATVFVHNLLVLARANE